MSVARFVVARVPEPGSDWPLAGEDAAHARARRLRAGDPVVLVDGSGREAAGTLAGGGRRLSVRVASVREAPAQVGPELRLFAAAVRPERLAWTVEKAAELGVARVTLVVTERTQPFRAREALRARLRRIAGEAAKQSGAARFPDVDGPAALADALALAAGNRLVLDPGGDAFPDSLPPSETSLLVGPEGGLTEAELAAARAAGWRMVSLPAGKLRSETAAIAAIVLARAAVSRSSR